MNALELTRTLMDAGLSCGEAARIVVAAERGRRRDETLADSVQRHLAAETAARAEHLRDLTEAAGLADNLSNSWRAAA